MRFFGKRRPQKHDDAAERDEIEKAIAAMSARLEGLEALTFGLVAELPSNKRDRLLQRFREVCAERCVLPPPKCVPDHRVEDFRNELRRVMQIYIEKAFNRA
jgi:hypothetical protein